MTLRLYAEFKKFRSPRVGAANHDKKIHAEDCETARPRMARSTASSAPSRWRARSTPRSGPRLLEIADKCPVHRTLKSEDRYPHRRAAGLVCHSGAHA